jgi:hypothetical protein
MYSEKRIKKFDEAEAALSAAMAKRKPRRRQV